MFGLTATWPSPVALIVAVCDAAGWIGPVAAAYQEMRLDPLFVVDARSADASLSILRGLGMRVAVHRGDHPRVESLMTRVIPTVRQDWIVRLDDDEVPSAALIAWIGRHGVRQDCAAVGLPRHWVLPEMRTGVLATRCTAAGGGWGADRQYRLFRPALVAPHDGLHTPGFTFPSHTDAPPSAALYHLDWIVRDRTARRAKMARYEAQESGMGERFARYYLPEDRAPGFYDTRPVARADRRRLRRLARRVAGE